MRAVVIEKEKEKKLKLTTRQEYVSAKQTNHSFSFIHSLMHLPCLSQCQSYHACNRVEIFNRNGWE